MLRPALRVLAVAGRCDHAAPKKDRDVFAFVIHEGKVRAPAAAMALMERVKG